MLQLWWQHDTIICNYLVFADMLKPLQLYRVNAAGKIKGKRTRMCVCVCVYEALAETLS